MNPEINKMEIVEPAAIKAWTEGRRIYIELTDSRIIGFPADRFKILSKATDHQLKEVKIRLDGFALRWESLDEDITVPGIDRGRDSALSCATPPSEPYLRISRIRLSS